MNRLGEVGACPMAANQETNIRYLHFFLIPILAPRSELKPCVAARRSFEASIRVAEMRSQIEQSPGTSEGSTDNLLAKKMI
jgi:hypothetical protein